VTTDSGRALRVLIVDDDSAMRDAVARMMRARDVVHACDGAEAIALVERGETFDLIVMDLEMPRMTGRVAFAKLEEIAPDLARRTLIMTGGSGVLELQQWLEGLGPGRLLLKPFSRRRLEEAIADLLAG
jgi:CheY-like chemotaxis protein